MPKPPTPGRALAASWLPPACEELGQLPADGTGRPGRHSSPATGYPSQARRWDHDHEGVDFARGLFVALAASAVCYGLIFAVLVVLVG